MSSKLLAGRATAASPRPGKQTPAGATGPAETFAPDPIGTRRMRPARTSAGSGARHRNPGADSGYSTVEAIFLLPVLVTCTLAVIQFALVWHARTVAESAARIGTQAARAYTATDADGLRQARAYLDAVDPGLLPGADIDATRTATTVEVHIHARALTVPGMPFTFAIDARSFGPLERFVEAADAPR